LISLRTRRGIMEKGAKTADKKAPAAKVATPQRKTATKRNISKGQAFACEVCGLSVMVEAIGDAVVEEDNVLLCCGKPMKQKAGVKKAVKK
jgi:hypothetical protein